MTTGIKRLHEPELPDHQTDRSSEQPPVKRSKPGKTSNDKSTKSDDTMLPEDHQPESSTSVQTHEVLSTDKGRDNDDTTQTTQEVGQHLGVENAPRPDLYLTEDIQSMIVDLLVVQQDYETLESIRHVNRWLAG
jgi:hypothetical protein